MSIGKRGGNLIAPSRASPLRGPCRNAGVEEKRRAAGSFDGGGARESEAPNELS